MRYLVLVSAIISLGWLALLVNSWVAWAFLLVLVAWFGWECWRWWQLEQASARLAALDLAKVEAETRMMQADADLREVQVKTAAARVQLIPDGYIGTMTPAPRPLVWTYKQEVSPAVVKVQEEAAQSMIAPALPSAPAYPYLLREIRAGHLILGYNLAGAIAGDLVDLLSTAIVGRPGTGKTTALRFVCAQVVRVGGRVRLIDPHGAIADEVSGLLDCAEDAQAMMQLAEQLECELAQRLLLRKAGEDVGPTDMTIADEWPVTSQLAPELIRVVGRIILEGRKVNMYALISGQGLPSDQLGGSLVRDALSSRYIFNTTALQARMAGLDNETAKTLLAQLDTAGPGYAILASARRRPEIVAVPDTNVEDLRVALGQRPELPPLPMKRPVSPSPAGEAEILPEAATNTSTGGRGKRSLVSDAERQEICEWAAQGLTPPEIATAMHRRNAFAGIIRLVLQEEEATNGE